MSSTPSEHLTSNQDHGSQESVGHDEAVRYGLGTENSPEETLRRMQGLPERAAKLMEIIRALREADTR